VPGDSIVIHGERDETVALAKVFDWARPQELRSWSSPAPIISSICA